MLIKKLSISIKDTEYFIKDITIKDFYNYLDFVKEIIKKENDIDYNVQIYYLSYFFEINEEELNELDIEILDAYATFLTDFIVENIISKILIFCNKNNEIIEEETKEDLLLKELYENEEEEDDDDDDDERLIYYTNLEDILNNLLYYYCMKTKDHFSNLLDKDLIIVMNYINFIYKNDTGNNNNIGADIDDLF